MDLLRLAFESSPTKAAKILSKIYKEDTKNSKLAKKLLTNTK